MLFFAFTLFYFLLLGIACYYSVQPILLKPDKSGFEYWIRNSFICLSDLGKLLALTELISSVMERCQFFSSGFVRKS